MDSCQQLIENKFNQLCHTASDINEHLPTLSAYASTASSIAEFGVRAGVSSYAFLHGLSRSKQAHRRLIGVDIKENAESVTIGDFARGVGIEYQFVKANSLDVQLSPVDILFIDSWHVYGQLNAELQATHELVKDIIIIHDTTRFEFESEVVAMPYRWANPRKPDNLRLIEESHFDQLQLTKGLWPAVEDFLADHPDWYIKERFTNNNGLTVLHR